MSTLSAFLFCIFIGMFFLPILKERAKEFYLPVSLLVSCAMISVIGDLFRELINQGSVLLSLSDNTFFPQVGKTLVIGIGTDCAACLARDGGLSSMAYKIELFGRISVLIVCIPIAQDFITWLASVMT